MSPRQATASHTWEANGLVEAIPAYLRSLDEATADRSLRELARILRELKDARVGYQVERARELREAVLGSRTSDSNAPQPAERQAR